MSLAILAATLSLATPAHAVDGEEPLVVERDNGPKPIDYGPGPGLPPVNALSAESAVEAAVPAGIIDAQTKGAFGLPFKWPIIAIHTVLLPDGRVLNYGTDESGQQGAQFVYDVWDPTQGTDDTSHSTLPNTTATDIFCGAQSVLSNSGNVLINGGDLTVDGVRNFSNDRTTIFKPRLNELDGSEQAMTYRRWYSTLVPLGNGDKLIVGGREAPSDPATTPEVFSETAGWRALSTADSKAAFGSRNWAFPRAYQMPANPNHVFILGHDGSMFRLNRAGNLKQGTIAKLAQTTLPGNARLPTVMYAPAKLLSLRANAKAIVIGLEGPQPTVTPTADVSQVREWANGTVLPNGQVLVSGGSAVANQIAGVAYAVEIWNPATGTWVLGAKAAKERLYHSTALLLPDATVLTAGGGAPGPVKNLNAEIYYPPYLFDSNGNPSPRPTLVSVPDMVSLSQNKTFTATVGSGNQISSVTLLHTGSVTHANNVEQRFQQLPFTKNGDQLTISAPGNPNYTVPGYYSLFVFNEEGVPAVAKIIKILR